MTNRNILVHVDRAAAPATFSSATEAAINICSIDMIGDGKNNFLADRSMPLVLH